MREKYQKLLDICLDLYKKSVDDGKTSIEKFLILLKLTKYIDLNSAEEVWLKAK